MQGPDQGADLLVHSLTKLLGLEPSCFRRISGICQRVKPCVGWSSNAHASSPSRDLHVLHVPSLLASGSGSKEIELMYMYVVIGRVADVTSKH